MPLSVAEREQFLAEPHVGSLAVARGPNNPPLVVPTWYHYTPGGELWVMTGADSVKARLIRAAGQFSLLVERVEPTIRYVSVEGRLARVEPVTRAHLEALHRRYLPEEQASRYVRNAENDGRERIVLAMRPERWFSSDLGTL
ncbi:pyridoxamine 5'-phosphate oxidase family protein [Thermasporomyces composti]|uniref:Pyridoxamine 5'-phosphate oxidase n=1 Tax=Thermasporomyces composti TaxID=696763 RepID=A0A3D9VKP3_THECX|nr:pyridoxamine 5'-phosphate oxidase family protein [Thermasporomyces composti]REF37941.1 pyridoxamine 5'-phosphate oxidase [Thermasporomyces composti]